jgi:thioredoxin reductase
LLREQRIRNDCKDETTIRTTATRMPMEVTSFSPGSVPGVFAVGDVRSGSIKRVGAAIGEGAQVMAAVHNYLAQHEPAAVAAE